jgi:hypothetical protein
MTENWYVSKGNKGGVGDIPRILHTFPNPPAQCHHPLLHHYLPYPPPHTHTRVHTHVGPGSRAAMWVGAGARVEQSSKRQKRSAGSAIDD